MYYIVHAKGIDPFVAIDREGIKQACEDLFDAHSVSFVRRLDDCLYVTMIDDDGAFEMLAEPQKRIYGSIQKSHDQDASKLLRQQALAHYKAVAEAL